MEEDFLMAINRLASCSYASNVEILAFSIMSTHFHIIAKSNTLENINNFISLYKRSINCWHNRKYLDSQKISISKRELINYYDTITAVNYVLKNPIHHNIVELPFSYPYSSINCYFNFEMNRSEYFVGEKITPSYKSPKDLSIKEYRYLFGTQALPDNYCILSNKLVIPESFVKIEQVETIYSNAKTFLYNIGKPLKEEVEEFGDDINSRNSKLNKITLCGKLTDIEVCQIIDSIIYPNTYTQLTDENREALWVKLKKLGVDSFQFNRAV